MADVPEPAVSPTPGPAEPRRQHTRYLLAGFYTLAVVWGTRNIYQNEPSALDLLVTCALAMCLAWWAVDDAHRRGAPIPVFTQSWLLMGAGIAVPIYFIWSRGWRALGWLALHTFLWLVLSAVITNAGGIILYGEKWFRIIGV